MLAAAILYFYWLLFFFFQMNLCNRPICVKTEEWLLIKHGLSAGLPPPPAAAETQKLRPWRERTQRGPGLVRWGDHWGDIMAYTALSFDKTLVFSGDCPLRSGMRKTQTQKTDLRLTTGLGLTLNWHERETWRMRALDKLSPDRRTNEQMKISIIWAPDGAKPYNWLNSTPSK